MTRRIEQFKPDLGHDLRVECLEGYGNFIRVIPVVEQNSLYFGACRTRLTSLSRNCLAQLHKWK